MGEVPHADRRPDEASLPVGKVLGLAAHEDRAAALGEVHARPHPLLSSPRLLIQLSFMTEGGSSVDIAVLTELARRQGIAAPDRQARHCVMKWGKGTLRWERHTEFSTYLWEGPLGESGTGLDDTPFGRGFSAPGTVISGIRLELRASPPAAGEMLEGFDAESLCHAFVEDGRAAIATDFRQDGQGLTRMLILDDGLSKARRGALAQRLIEIETYRTLAMLGLPLAQSLSGQLRRMEDRLAELTGEMRGADRRNSRELLGELTELAAELEAQAASSLYRFGASRAYYDIVTERLAALGEVAAPGAQSWEAFLTRRVAPAMRTCRSVEERQAGLSRKLARAAQLLRTWVDVEVEKQNRDLLASMNNRARQQLRLQQTVEGLSVAAVSYYVVGLVAYMVRSHPILPPWLPPETVIGLSVPVVVLGIWLFVRRIRRHFTDDGKPDA
ncbi:DUF3422 family protein [Chelativorans sp. ZYF759]|uniref:DUF3422 family protein n=1 Tax=Chelativorans sp. ZYF759 TaxID=2692213 RepID=UPI00145DCA74|nr:DUF3422 family protein [Chelativorans sp. ZYF759]NMG41862.1 DUF3422 family protein [Chelativorans sp. ZYF759]